jgi:hypothetical protein
MQAAGLVELAEAVQIFLLCSMNAAMARLNQKTDVCWVHPRPAGPYEDLQFRLRHRPFEEQGDLHHNTDPRLDHDGEHLPALHRLF